jgi:hypothetical protein
VIVVAIGRRGRRRAECGVEQVKKVGKELEHGVLLGSPSESDNALTDETIISGENSR